MILTSPAFKHNQPIPHRFTCDGDNVSPPLVITDVPAGAKSLVLIVDDPDAVPFAGHVFVHWTLCNINPKTHIIDEGSVPHGSLECATSYGKPGWGGPCPPAGNHHYHFKLYALNTILNVSSEANKSDCENAMHGFIVDQTELMGTYKRTP